MKETINYTVVERINKYGDIRIGYVPVYRDLGPKLPTTLDSQIPSGSDSVPREMMTQRARNNLTPRRLRGKT